MRREHLGAADAEIVTKLAVELQRALAAGQLRAPVREEPCRRCIDLMKTRDHARWRCLVDERERQGHPAATLDGRDAGPYDVELSGQALS